MRGAGDHGGEGVGSVFIADDDERSRGGVEGAEPIDSDRSASEYKCECQESGFCHVRQRRVNVLLWAKCQAGGSEQVSRLLQGVSAGSAQETAIGRTSKTVRNCCRSKEA